MCGECLTSEGTVVLEGGDAIRKNCRKIAPRLNVTIFLARTSCAAFLRSFAKFPSVPAQPYSHAPIIEFSSCPALGTRLLRCSQLHVHAPRLEQAVTPNTSHHTLIRHLFLVVMASGDLRLLLSGLQLFPGLPFVCKLLFCVRGEPCITASICRLLRVHRRSQFSILPSKTKECELRLVVLHLLERKDFGLALKKCLFRVQFL